METGFKPISSYTGKAELLFSLYLKLVGLILIAFSIGYWGLLVGARDPAIGFDTLAVHWRFALAGLVVLQPVAAIGLWANMRWGVVVWIIIVAVEVAMYGVFTELYGTANRLLIFHATSLTCYFLALALFAVVRARLLREAM